MRRPQPTHHCPQHGAFLYAGELCPECGIEGVPYTHKPLPRSPRTRDEKLILFMTYLDADAVKAAWKVMAQKYHPDHGGNPTVAAEFNAAFEQVSKLYDTEFPKK
jgi:hypothetical protein